MKKPASKVAEPAQIQPKSQFLFPKNLPPRDFSYEFNLNSVSARSTLLETSYLKASLYIQAEFTNLYT